MTRRIRTVLACHRSAIDDLTHPYRAEVPHPAAPGNMEKVPLDTPARIYSLWQAARESLPNFTEELVGMALFVLAFPALFFAFALVTP